MTAADARSHLVQLEAERAVAHVEGLDDEIDEWRRALHRDRAERVHEPARAWRAPRTRKTLDDGRLGRYDCPSQASTLSRFSASQSRPAFSGSSLSPAIALATAS